MMEGISSLQLAAAHQPTTVGIWRKLD